jgi:hypothetical protein
MAALLSPLAMGTWKLKPGGWQPLPVDQREKIAQMAAETDNCTHDVTPKTEYSDAICIVLLSELHAGGHYESGERITWRYTGKNLEPMVMTFAVVFLAAMILPALGARYWAWLKR